MVQETTSVLKSNPITTVINEQDVACAVAGLNKGKAADMEGIRAEHIIFTNDRFKASLAFILNGMLHSGACPEMKTGRKVPIPKKNKDVSSMQNFRGITISSTLGKFF